MEPARYVVLLRGINLVKRNRISMPDLRAALVTDGFKDVATYVQSGNIVLSSRADSQRVAAAVNQLIKKRFALDVVVVVRSGAEMAEIVRRNPLHRVVVNPRRYLVTFLSSELPVGFGADLSAVAAQEPFAIVGREVYSWHPDGVGRSPLWERLANKKLGVVGTSRNWVTVTRLAAMSAVDPKTLR